MSATVDHATHACQITRLEIPDFIPHCHHTTHDLMTGHGGILRVVPFVACGMQI